MVRLNKYGVLFIASVIGFHLVQAIYCAASGFGRQTRTGSKANDYNSLTHILAQ